MFCDTQTADTHWNGLLNFSLFYFLVFQRAILSLVTQLHWNILAQVFFYEPSLLLARQWCKLLSEKKKKLFKEHLPGATLLFWALAVFIKKSHTLSPYTDKVDNRKVILL